MNQKNILKSLLFVAAAFLGLAASSARAADAQASVPAAPVSQGLLGQAYAGLSYSYINLDGAPVNAASYGFEYNEPLNTGFDAVFNYDWAQSGVVAGNRAKEETLAAALRAFCTKQTWGKPYIEAGIGYDWAKFAGVKDRSFVWSTAAGVEFQAAPGLTVTPYVRYALTNGFAEQDNLNYGVKANYWINKMWAVSGGIDRNNDHDMTYKIGVNVRF